MIHIEEESRLLLTFRVVGRLWRFRVMPFGLGIAPYVCQTFLGAIIRYIRRFTKHVAGYIDDILIGHRSKAKLVRFGVK